MLYPVQSVMTGSAPHHPIHKYLSELFQTLSYPAQPLGFTTFWGAAYTSVASALRRVLGMRVVLGMVGVGWDCWLFVPS